MTHTRIPNTSLNVTRVCLGTGGIGSASNQSESEAVLDCFLEGGGNFIDTAHNYGDWVKDLPRSASEKAIGTWLKNRNCRDRVVLATKGGHPFFDAPEKGRLSREEIRSDLHGSLESLQTDSIDLYWLHADEPCRPVEEILQTLNELIQEGKVRYVGASNWKTSRIKAANEFAKQNNLAGFVGDQVLWNAADLAVYPYGNPTVGFVNRERYDFHLDSGLALIPFQAHAFGLFSRMESGTLDQMNKGFRGFYKEVESTERYVRMKKIAEESGLTLTQVVLGYLSSQPFTTIPIVGSHTVSQVQDSLAALEVVLSQEQLDMIDGGQKGSELP